MFVEKEYICGNPDCGDGLTFLVHFSNKTAKYIREHKQICVWCGRPASASGVESKLFKRNIITYKNGVEIGRRERIQR